MLETSARLLRLLSLLQTPREWTGGELGERIGVSPRTIRSDEAEPYQLVNWGRRWYLVAFDVGREDWRTFRVDRITPRTPGGGRFTPRPLPASDLADWVARRVATAVWPHRARVTVFAPAAAVS